VRTLSGPALAVALLLAVLASPADAETFFGAVVPDVPSRAHVSRAPAAHLANLPYGGGPVLHWNRTHVIFWQPSGSGLTFEPGYLSLIEKFLAHVAADSRSPGNVYGLSGQYRDATGPAAYASTYGGAVLATDPLPANGCSEPPGPPLGTGPGWHVCLDAEQLENEVAHVLEVDRLPAALRDVYFLVTPSGLGSCQFEGPGNCALGGDASGSYCGYHSATARGTPYAVIPYNAVPGHCQSGKPHPNSSSADPTISTISHEHNEAVTDPLGDAWIDESFAEDGDLCVSNFGQTLGGSGAGAWNQVIHGGHYYLQDEWSNDDGSCQPRDESDRLSFSVRPRGPATVRFASRASDRDGSIVAYNWFFGDRRIGRRRVVRHTFKPAGSYRVVLRTTDRAGNWAFYARRIRVSGVGRGEPAHRGSKP
jgi:PKD domain